LFCKNELVTELRFWAVVLGQAILFNKWAVTAQVDISPIHVMASASNVAAMPHQHATWQPCHVSMQRGSRDDMDN